MWQSPQSSPVALAQVWRQRGRRGRQGMEAGADVQREALHLAPLAVEHQQRLLLPRLAHGHCAVSHQRNQKCGTPSLPPFTDHRVLFTHDNGADHCSLCYHQTRSNNVNDDIRNTELRAGQRFTQEE